jgi:2-polyprenyl-3-methyl-5-hydroxy-6-metoxy-1,4-benzoquinol methylase
MREELRELILETVEANQDLAPSDAESVRRQLDRPAEPDASGAVLDSFELQGKRVLDLAAGIGDLCRTARSAGAALVDGLEPDPHLARLARLLNAYQLATRVSIFDRDDALAQLPAERYDVVLALRSAEALTTAPERVAELCPDGVLVAPASAGEGIERRFPHQRELRSDEGALVAYSASEAALAAIVRL